MPKVATSNVNEERNAKERQRNQTLQKGIDELGRFLNKEHLRKLDIIKAALGRLKEDAVLHEQDQREKSYLADQLTHQGNTLRAAHQEIARLRAIVASIPELAQADENQAFIQNQPTDYHSSLGESSRVEFIPEPQMMSFQPQLHYHANSQMECSRIDVTTSPNFRSYGQRDMPEIQIPQEMGQQSMDSDHSSCNSGATVPAADRSPLVADYEDALSPADEQTVNDYRKVEIDFDYFLNDDEDLPENQDIVPLPYAIPQAAAVDPLALFDLSEFFVYP